MSAETIVVGVDGSPGSKDAAAWAAREARLRGARLVAVHAWALPLVVGLPEPSLFGNPLVSEPDLGEVRKAVAGRAGEVLEEALAGLEDGPVERRAVEAPPAQALLEAAEGADLLVLGSRGHGGFAGLLLGSVSQQCVQHAPCPVVVVPAPR